MDVRIDPTWRQALAGEWEKPYFADLAAAVRRAYAATEVFPPAGKVFAAFDATPFDRVKVVIIGQDPYHDVGQANGLAFSVAPGVPLPPSLVNIFREVHDDVGAPIPADGDLGRWARQGVLLLNSTLTVQAHRPASHGSLGWDRLTDEAIIRLSRDRQGLVFILWGAHAMRKAPLIDPSRGHLVLQSAHPSPLSAYRGFFGSKPFSKANQWLVDHGQEPIVW